MSNNTDDELITYKCADSEPVYGEFGWVTDLEYFEDDDEPRQLIRERWVLAKRETFWHLPSLRWQCCAETECDEGADGWREPLDGSEPVALCEHHLCTGTPISNNNQAKETA